MFNPAYLTKSRTGIFHLRWPIPKQLHPQKKASTLKLSLRTRNPQKALRLSRSVSEIAHTLIDHGITTGMKYEEIRALLKQHFEELLQRRQDRIRADGRLSIVDRQALGNSIGLAQDAVETKSPLLLVTDDDEVLADFVKLHQVPITKGTRQYDQLQQEMRLAYRDYAEAVLAFDDEFDRFDFSSSSGEPERTALKQESHTLSLKDMAQAYAAEKKLAGSWVRKTENEKGEHIALLMEIITGNKRASDIGALDAKRVKDTLLKYPKNRSKNPMTRDKPLGEVLGLKEVDKIQVATINKYLQTYSDLFEWGRKQGYVQENRFSGLTIRQKKGSSLKGRTAFTKAEASAILAALTGERPDLVTKPYQKWGPLIGLYTGARLNEIAQLEVTDVCQQGDIWCFNINDQGDGKHLKSTAARRFVPVHRKLVELGFLTFVEAARQNGQAKLFPDFTYSPQNGWGRNLGRWFNERFLPKLELKSEKHVFHSLRHTVVTMLMQADIAEPVVKAIVGHSQQGVTQQHYFKKGYTLQQLNEALQTLDYGPADTGG